MCKRCEISRPAFSRRSVLAGTASLMEGTKQPIADVSTNTTILEVHRDRGEAALRAKGTLVLPTG